MNVFQYIQQHVHQAQNNSTYFTQHHLPQLQQKTPKFGHLVVNGKK